jgi:hypothetical protein
MTVLDRQQLGGTSQTKLKYLHQCILKQIPTSERKRLPAFDAIYPDSKDRYFIPTPDDSI